MSAPWSPKDCWVRFVDKNSKYHRPDKIDDLWYCLTDYGLDRIKLPIKFGKFTIKGIELIDDYGLSYITVTFTVKDVKVDGSKLLGGYIFINSDIMTHVFASCHFGGAGFKADLSAYTDYVLDGLFDNSKVFTEIIPKMKAEDKFANSGGIHKDLMRYQDVIYKFDWR